MNFDLLFVCDAFFLEEVGNSLSIVTLKLDNLAVLLIVDNGTIAVPSLLKVSVKLFHVQVIWETLDNGHTLSSGTLLELDMNKVSLSGLDHFFTCESSSIIKLVCDIIGFKHHEFIFVRSLLFFTLFFFHLKNYYTNKFLSDAFK